MHAYLDAMRRYATAQGRASRADYWRAHLVFGPLILVAFFGLGVPFVDGPRSIWPALLFVLIVGSHAAPWTALTVRRLHDMDLSGRWALLGLGAFIPVVPLGVIVLLLRCLRDGQPGPNRFGPDPLDRAPASAPSPTEVPPVASTPMPTAASPPAAPRRDVVAELERLAQLRTAGTLSEAEFVVLKAQILNGGRQR
ncbi:DUF805 domain-containing protein [Methylobacterium sp. J-030]|uniref:DUF805 domain-containing protein n=1 Tax=Methylobacterium sp. J-030 TaxID=2836627 RepID=UPI001FB86A6E|nr:DUF805 domain-containing protein [Methylobacterium sp. J-030]MCJ2067314.1 DUF805 domain-containing protein [Methylobacterium sp. J-030]